MGFPPDTYTPHGYLDNPQHTRNLNPSGVIRSTPGVGFGWHYPALARGYGFQEIYHAALNLALSTPEGLVFRPRDFADLHASYHSKNLFTYKWRTGAVAATAIFFRVGEHALACRVTLEATSEATAQLCLVALSTYARQLGAAGRWGESGLVGRIEGDRVVLQGFEDGEAFALGATRTPDASGISATLDETWLRAPTLSDLGHVVVTGRRGDTVTLYGAQAYDLTLEPHGTVSLDLVLARGLRRDLALQQHAQALTERDREMSARVEEDRRFWSMAPTLKGDWPEHWRRGFVYDFETLRMMVKAPVGIYTHAWDAMQIQAPRVVLAEAAIDALLLAYADPATARELLLGTFLDAPAANVPCSREDGSYNMVGASGSECGTAPEWGYPLEVVRFVYDLDPQPQWLAALYSKLGAFLRWWLTHRRDAEGYVVYDNSWESGQDLSARFGPQKEGGGSTIRMVRPVDLQAAMASAFRAMKGFAKELNKADDAQLWQTLEEEFVERVESLWHEGEYRDYDARVGWSDVWDIMQLAPMALNIAGEERIEALRARIATLAQDAYLWPMFVWTATDAALVAGKPEVASRIAADTIDRAYRYWDARTHEEGRPLPGVTCEYWGTDGRCGAEGYGWGAFGIHLVLRSIVGFKPKEDSSFVLAPNLPDEMLSRGHQYGVTNLAYLGVTLHITYLVVEEELEITVSACGKGNLSVADQQGEALTWRAPNRSEHKVHVIPTFK